MAKARHFATIFPLLLVGGALLFVAIPEQSDSDSSVAVETFLGANGKKVESRDFFVRPFLSDFGETGISFDGGKYPIVDHRLPRIGFGDEGSERRLQIAMLTDWTNPNCREAYHRIDDLYSKGDGKNLPSIDLYLLPIYHDEQGRLAHESVLTAFFGSNKIETFGDLLAGIGAGAVAADSQAGREHISVIDSDLADRWESLSIYLRERFSYTFSMAFKQLRHNKHRLDHADIPQLLVFDSILAGRPTRETLAGFLRNAAERQLDYFGSPEGATPLVIDRSCNCNDPTHNHTLLQTQSANSSANQLIESISPPLPASGLEVSTAEN